MHPRRTPPGGSKLTSALAAEYGRSRGDLPPAADATPSTTAIFGLPRSMIRKIVARTGSAGTDARIIDGRIEELTALNKELEAFTYSVAHDLRSPLRAIDCFARVLLEEHGPKLDGEGQRILGLICQNAHHMGELIGDLLAFSRLGWGELAKRPVDMAALAASVVGELREQEPDRPVEVAIGPLAPALGDEGLLRQVLGNLVSNALKFTRPSPAARVEIASSEAADARVVYHVKDNGVGFDMRYSGRLFGVFQRLHSTQQFEGTGVGLAIVQRIVQRHGGRVWANGEVGGGATFSFALPGGRSGP